MKINKVDLVEVGHCGLVSIMVAVAIIGLVVALGNAGKSNVETNPATATEVVH